MTTSPDQPDASAADAWKLMFDFLMKSAPQRLESQQKHGLTPNDSRALFSLDKAGKPVGTLAREWGCDPSTATWLVDRLERAGLAERVPSPDDRRVKLVRVTRRGTETLQDLMAAYQRPPAEMSRLSRDELAALVGILGKLRKDA
ncbi:MarR family winged helix-turn-helix transcriptional regulator [Pigmentiphaga daeguensis]|jgi:DNA-binding MarR family transcriptional regulator|uniref:MarR family transcriptional regulator n=1 Tax=Pigmentiphaga daeguensis TaxID=414049 RepID=A0ABN1BTI5_9BURK